MPSDRAVLAILVVLALLYLQQQDEAPSARARKRARTAAASPAPAARSLLACVKWETIANMLRWKSELSGFDGILQGLDDISVQR